MRHLALVVISTALLIACATQPVQQRAGVLDYLYPEGTAFVPPGDVRLDLPLRVGVAFAPSSGEGPRHLNSYYTGDFGVYYASFDASAQQRLLERVAAAFEGTSGVDSIQIVPPHLMTPQGGFTNVEQLRLMLGLDVIALLSYEQTQFQDFNHASLTYLTVVGAYLVEANKNETHTFVDTSVFDIRSRALLFNAGGRSVVQGNSTPVQASENLRNDSAEGFEMAIEDMVGELQITLAGFREQILSGTVRGVGTPGLVVTGQGAGAAGALELCLAVLLAGGGLLARRAGRA